MSSQSVVSLVPAATEILYAIGVEPAATSHACDYPPAARDLPTACHSAISGTTSAEINTSVANSNTQQNGGFSLDRSVINSLDPDIVITQGLCEVCAIDQATVTRTIQALDCSPDIITCHPHSFEDVIDTIRAIGEAVNRSDAATSHITSIRERIRNVTNELPDTTPSIAILDWMDPIMVAGHWVPDLISRAGGTPVIQPRNGDSGPIEWDVLRETDPDKLLVAPCGYSLARTAKNSTELTRRPGWHTLTAVNNDEVYCIDGNDYINRPGPRLVDSLEIIAHILHPTQFSPPPESTIRTLTDLSTATETTS